MRTLIVILILFIPSFAFADCRDSYAYGSTDPFYFRLFNPDGVDLKEDAVFASGDLTLTCDGGTPASPTNGFVDEGDHYSWTPDTDELNCKRAVLSIKDQGTKAWLDEVCIIATYQAGSSGAHNTTVSAIATDAISAASVSQAAAEKIGAEASGGGGGEGDWTTGEKNQIRYRLAIDGTKAVPTNTPTPGEGVKIGERRD